jgi:hypothetical protein
VGGSSGVPSAFLQPMSIIPLAAVPRDHSLRVAASRLVLNTRPAVHADGLWIVVKVAWYYGKTMLTDWKETVASRALVGVNAGAVGCHGTFPSISACVSLKASSAAAPKALK